MTESQRSAVTTWDCGLLVSAAAGSGKTATLAERVAHLVCDETVRCAVEQILVVTFTENAAAEMRARIDKVLRERAAECGSDHARRQAMLTGRATVGTIHSFCARLLRQHFQRLGIDPRFGILPGEEAAVLEAETLRAVLDAGHLERPEAMRLLAEWYGNGDDEKVGELVMRLHRLTAAVVDPDDWRRRAIRRLEEAADSPRTSGLGHEFEIETARRLTDLKARCESVMALVSEFPKYVEYVRDVLLNWVTLWDAQFARRGEVWGIETTEIDLGKLPPYPSGTPGKDEAMALVSELKDDIKSGPFPEGLPTDETFWRESLGACLPHARELVWLAEAYEAAYRTAKDARRALDFNDLERLALRLLQTESGEPSDVARMLHKQYRFVLVDECQDVNAVQDRILSLVSTEGLPRSEAASNLFSVGDVKQSVYRFRLADPDIFREREKRYARKGSGGRVIRLSENFRSRGPLLEVVNAVFVRLMVGGRTEVDYLDGHTLKAGKPQPEATFGGSPAELHLLPPKPKVMIPDGEAVEDSGEELDLIEREAELVARRIGELMGRRPGPDGVKRRATVYDKTIDAVREIRHSDIAVLLRVGRVKAKLLASMLRRRGVPVFADVKGGLLETQEVRDVLALLQLLDNPDRDLPLASYLRSPLSLLPEPEEAMARARAAFPKEAFHQAVRKFADSLADEYAAALADALDRAFAWRELARRRNVADVLEDIYERTYFTAYTGGLPDGAQRQANLVELLGHARSYAAEAGSDIGGFNAFIRAIEEQENDLDQPTVVPGGAEGGSDVVTVQTVHKSKGLEYAVVFLPDLAKKFNLKDLSGNVLADRDTLLSPKAPHEAKGLLYPTPAWMLAKSQQRPKLLAEELRVLYVAMTRAREHLILVGSCDEKMIEKARQLWSGHPGALPESAVMEAGCALEWVLWAAMSAAAGKEPVFELIRHDEAQVKAWTDEAAAADSEPVPQAVLELRPLPETSVVAATGAKEALELLAWRYPHVAAARRRAAVSVTALTHGTPASHETASYGESQPNSIERTPPTAIERPTQESDALSNEIAELRLPRSLAEDTAEVAMTAAEVGTATHLALEYLDFTSSTSSGDLAAFVESLVRKNVLEAREASKIRTDDLRFVIEHPELGPLLRGERGRVHRELAINLPHVPEGETADDPLDRQMVRGRIDVLVETAEGPVVIDYKTDNVWGERLEERVRLYAKQVGFYQRAARAITGRECAGVYLAFVNERARVVRKL